jgi:hypothetical protein
MSVASRAIRQHRGDLSGELLGSIWFLQQATCRDNIGRVTSGEQHLKSGAFLTCSSCHLDAVEPWHHHVGEQQVDLVVIAQQNESSRSIGRSQDCVAALLQHIARIVEDTWVIVDDKDGFAGCIGLHARRPAQQLPWAR